MNYLTWHPRLYLVAKVFMLIALTYYTAYLVAISTSNMVTQSFLKPLSGFMLVILVFITWGTWGMTEYNQARKTGNYTRLIVQLIVGMFLILGLIVVELFRLFSLGR